MKGKTRNKLMSFLLALILCSSMLISAVPALATGETHTFNIASGVKAASDDMEEWITSSDPSKIGALDYNSSDLELGLESPGDAITGAQYVGIRFADLAIPAGATITNAYIQFTVDEVKSPANPFDVNIVAEDVANSATFNNGNTSSVVVPYDISSRTTTTASVNWAPANDDSTLWTVENEAGENQRTPDLSGLVQAIIDKDGWASGNALSFIITGSGNRTAISYDKDPAKAPALYVTFSYNGVMEQAAPTGLDGVAPTTDANADGQITGTTAAMEYKLSADPDTSYTACMDGATTGLIPGEYDVRYAATDGYNVSLATAVTIPAFTAGTYAATEITFQPGSDPSIMRFAWYSNIMASTQSVIQVALKSDMTGADFPTAAATSFTGTVADSNGFKSNEVVVTGLAAATGYVYRVGDGTNFSDVYSFKTHNTASYNTILVGDPQIGSSGNIASDTAGWENTVTQALTNFPETSFILSAGDQVNTSTNEDQYTGFFAPSELTNMPLVPAIGNHDNSGTLYSYHYNSPNESATYGTTSAGGDYWFTYGNTLYMVLNSNNQSAASHEAFIQQTIDAAGSGIVWKVVMFHHSIYSSANHSIDGDILSRRSDLYPIFDKYDIDVVLAGHDHCYTRTYQMEGGVAQNGLESAVENPTGTLYITANSGSGSKYYDLAANDTTYSAVHWQGYVPSYSNIEITGNTFTITTYRSDRTSSDPDWIIDTYTITKDQAGAPAGLAGIAPTTTANDDGIITGTTSAMEYKLSSETTWTPCANTQTENLLPGLYDVRYAGAVPSVSALVTVPVYGGVNQEQEAPTGLTGLAPTTDANNDGRITGTTTDMEYMASGTWIACTGTEITGLAPGSYSVRYMEKPGFSASPATVVLVPAFSNGMGSTVISRISAALDDMEERPDGSLDYDSSDLEITREKEDNNQQIGLRFANLPIPEGAVISSAYIQFSVDEPDKNADPFNVSIYTDDTADSAPFENVPFTVSSRMKSVASVTWSGIPDWTVTHEAGADQRTPDLSALIQQIIDKDGWAPGNAISFILAGDGTRTAESYEGAGSHTEQIPTLHIVYGMPEKDTTPPEISINMPDGAIFDRIGTFDLMAEATDDSGVASFEVTLDGASIDPQAVIDFSDLEFGTHTLSLAAEDTADNTAGTDVHFELTGSINTLMTVLNNFYKSGDITNKGVYNSLKTKLEKHNLKAFMNELNAKVTKKHISDEASEELMYFAQWLNQQASIKPGCRAILFAPFRWITARGLQSFIKAPTVLLNRFLHGISFTTCCRSTISLLRFW